jgi:hypothetical protein
MWGNLPFAGDCAMSHLKLVKPPLVDREAITPLYRTPNERMQLKQAGMRGYHNGRIQISEREDHIVVVNGDFFVSHDASTDWSNQSSDLSPIWTPLIALSLSDLEKVIKAIDGDPRFPWHRELRKEANRTDRKF